MTVLNRELFESVDQLGGDEKFVLQQVSLGYPLPKVETQLKDKTDRNSDKKATDILDEIYEKFDLRHLVREEKMRHAAAKRWVDYDDMRRSRIKPLNSDGSQNVNGAAADLQPSAPGNIAPQNTRADHEETDTQVPFGAHRTKLRERYAREAGETKPDAPKGVRGASSFVPPPRAPVTIVRNVPEQADAEIPTPTRLGAMPIWASLPKGEWQEVLARVGKAIAEGKYVTVDPFEVRPMKGQPREYFPAEEQGSLEESMDFTGQIQDAIIRSVPHVSPPEMSPLRIGDRLWRVDETGYEVCDGERRWRSTLEKGMSLRAKLIEIDDVGAYFVSAVANFNRVGHTALEQARNLKRLLEGEVKFPFEVAIVLQGISKSKAERLLGILKLPSDVQDLMHPGLQKAKGEEVLGKSFSYEIARLADNPVLHEHARDIARRAVRRQVKLPQVKIEVDRILSRSGTGRDVLGERNQPARRMKAVEGRLTIAFDNMRDVNVRLAEMKAEDVLPEGVERLGSDLNEIADMAEEALRIIGVERQKSESQ